MMRMIKWGLFFAFLSINCECLMADNILNITCNGVTKTATLVDNDATAALKVMLKNGPVTISMTENGGFEKVGDLPQALPASDVRQTAQSGDIMLYIGNVLCIFYGSNTWAYTKIGRLDNMTSSEIREFLSGNPVQVTLSIEGETSVNSIETTDLHSSKVYDLAGNLISHRPLKTGIYIIDGVKTMIR